MISGSGPKPWTRETIASWMNRQPTAWHPNYDDLLVDYSFDGANGTERTELQPQGGPGLHHGSTLRRTTQPVSRPKGLGQTSGHTSVLVVANISSSWPMVPSWICSPSPP